MDTQWKIELFGGLRVEGDGRVITRFRTQKTSVLLAYLAYYDDRKHPREVLCELLWPECVPAVGRNRLRVELNSLRKQLEPPGVPQGTVLVADRHAVWLNPAAVTTDVAEFETALRRSNDFSRYYTDAERMQDLTRAVELYRGELLPGDFAEWIEAERQRLADAYLGALHRLTRLLAQAREFDRALDYAHRAVGADPLREESYCTLMRLYTALGRPAAALQQFHELKRLLKEELDAAPSAATRTLAREISEQLSVSSNQKAEGRRQKTAHHRSAVGSRQSAEERASRSTHQDTPKSEIQNPKSSGSLPLQFTRFFGREDEIARLTAMLQEGVPTADSADSADSPHAPRSTPHAPRLITLTGPGGSGKTRLAIEVAKRTRDEFPGGVWFVPLADLSDPRLIVDKVRDVLRLPRSPEVEPLEQVVAALSWKSALLVLDNFERLAASGALMVLTLLKRVPSLKCLVTSHRRLDVAGERVFPVLSLPIPHDSNEGVKGCKGEGVNESSSVTPSPLHPFTPSSLMQFPSVQLFVDRAQAVHPDFQVTARNAPAVAELCRRLEGIPLAIELAAARSSVLTPAEMLIRLAQRFELLMKRGADTGERHRSLLAALEWSYHLLTPEVQRFFARLSVFRGGWSLEAAAQVCSQAIYCRPDEETRNELRYYEQRTVDYLAQLRAHSLVLAEEGVPQMRFRLLETLREFAVEQLTPAERAALARRHAYHFLALAEEAESHLAGARQKEWLDRLEAEHDNLRAALAWSLDGGEADVGLRLAGVLVQFWNVHGHFREGREWLMQAVASCQVPGDCERPSTLRAERAKALYGAGILTWQEGDYAKARTLCEESLTLWRALDDKIGIANVLHHLGNMTTEQGDYGAAQALYEESLTMRRELGDEEGIARSLCQLGILVNEQGDTAAAHALLEESLALFRKLGNTWGVAWVHNWMGQIASSQGDYKTARALYEKSLTLFRELGAKRGIAASLLRLGDVALRQTDYTAARAFCEESLRLFWALGHKMGTISVLERLTVLSEAQGQPEWVARVSGAVDALREAIGAPLPLAERSRYEHHIAAARAALGEKAFAAARAEGRAMTLEQVVACALEAPEPP